MDNDADVGPVASEILAYYDQADESSRLATGLGLIEWERTRQIVSRRLPAPPGVVLDVGCGGGAHAVWLGAAGYEVHVSDPVPGHVDEARAAGALRNVEFASATVGHAAALAHEDESADAILELGPLYHLCDPDARASALREAVRVLRPGGWFFGAAISRFTSMVNAFRDELLTDTDFYGIVLGDLDSGRHDNTTADPAYFTTAFVHRPDELASELAAAGLVEIEIVAIEGLASAARNIDALWADDRARTRLLKLLDLTEREPSVLGASTHLLGIGRRPSRR